MTVIRPILAFTDEDGWHAGIGDPTVLGWVTVVGYFVAGLLAFRAAWKVRHEPGKLRVFWSSLTLVLILLGINKQLDLQTWLTITARRLAVWEGWYGKRRALQFAFIILVTISGVVGFKWMWSLVQDQTREMWWALAGLFFLMVFVVIRAASFHHVDQFLKYDIGGFRLNWIFELGGICMVARGAFLARHSRGRNPDRPHDSNHAVVKQ
ncbi:MAG: hypothetical protein ACTHMT_10080 [Verrucomicrobiota bacterium]